MRPLAILKYLLLITLTLNSASNIAVAQDTFLTHEVQDTIRAAAPGGAIPNDSPPDDGFDVFVLLFGMAVVCFMLGFVFLGLVAAIILIVIATALLATGILSVSIFTGWYRKSVSKGTKTLFALMGMLGGAICGILGFGIISLLFDLELERQTIALTGTITGGVAGLLLGLIIYKMLMLALKYIQKRFGGKALG